MSISKRTKNNIILAVLISVVFACVAALVTFLVILKNKTNEELKNEQSSAVSWHLGTEDVTAGSSDIDAKEGDFYININTLSIYTYTNDDWVKSNLTFDTNNETYEGQPGENGVGIKNIYEEFERDENEDLYVVYKLEMTDGSIINAGKVLIKKEVINVELSSREEFFVEKDDRPTATLYYDDGTTKEIEITESMYVNESPYIIPDFTLAGNYTCKIDVLGFEYTKVFNIKNVTAEERIINIYLVDSNFLPYFYYEVDYYGWTYDQIKDDFLPIEVDILFSTGEIKRVNLLDAYNDNLFKADMNEMYELYFYYRHSAEAEYMSYYYGSGYNQNYTKISDLDSDELDVEIEQSYDRIYQPIGEPLPENLTVTVKISRYNYKGELQYATWTINYPLNLEENTLYNTVRTFDQHSNYLNYSPSVGINIYDPNAESESPFFVEDGDIVLYGYYGDPNGEVYEWASKEYQINNLKRYLSSISTHIYFNEYREVDDYKVNYDRSKGLFYIVCEDIDCSNFDFDSLDYEHGTPSETESSISFTSEGETYTITIKIYIEFEWYGI